MHSTAYYSPLETVIIKLEDAVGTSPSSEELRRKLHTKLRTETTRTRIACVNKDGHALVYDLNFHEPVLSIIPDTPVNTMVLLSATELVIAYNDRLELWDITSKRCKKYPIEEKLFVAMAVGPYVLAVPSDENILVVWNTGTNIFNRKKIKGITDVQGIDDKHALVSHKQIGILNLDTLEFNRNIPVGYLENNFLDLWDKNHIICSHQNLIIMLDTENETEIDTELDTSNIVHIRKLDHENVVFVHKRPHKHHYECSMWNVTTKEFGKTLIEHSDDVFRPFALKGSLIVYHEGTSIKIRNVYSMEIIRTLEDLVNKSDGPIPFTIH
jgi:hypothetical protein